MGTKVTSASLVMSPQKSIAGLDTLMQSTESRHISGLIGAHAPTIGAAITDKIGKLDTVV